MKKFTLTLSFLIFSFILIFAQTYTINTGGTISTCSGTFYDSGGGSGTYQNNENYTMTFCSNNGGNIRVAFSAFNIESSYDYLYIYNGPNTSSSLIGTYTGTTSPGTITASGSCLTFVFTSDGSVTYDGWTATISCTTPTAPTVQDCAGAIPLCFSTYSTTTSYSGQGNFPTEIPTHLPYYDNMCPGNCLLAGELNDVWYTFTVQTSGTVTFAITPNSSGDDYDWAVYNLTNAECADIYSNPSLQVSCNFCGTAGVTGPNGGSANTCQPGNSCTLTNAALNVTAGQTYVVNVSNFSSTQSGYSINFGGTAQVVDNVGPYLYNIVQAPACGQNQVVIRFSENVLCSTVQASDFTISGPGGPYTVTAVNGAVCAAGGSYERDFVLTVSPAFVQGGTYIIGLVNNSVSDICSHPTGGQTLNFSVTGVSASASVVSNVSCYGGNNGSATATGTGGTAPYTYSWSNGSTVANPTGLAAGTYTVTVKDANNVCNATAQITITQPTQLTATISNTSVSCNGGNNGTASVSPSGGTAGYTYLWNTTSTASSISGLTAGTYSVTVTDSKGCSVVKSTTVSQPTALSVSTSQTNVSCFGGNNGSATVSVSGGTPSYTYSWSNSQTTATASGLTAGTYTVTIKDANNCSTTRSFTISQPTAVTASISSQVNVSCSGGNNGTATVSPGGGSAPYTYSWSNTQTSQTATGLSAGTYTVTVRDANSCSATTSVTISQPSALSVSISKTNVLCNGGSTGSATANPSGGTAGYTYSWSNSQTTQTISGLAAGTYTVTVRDANNCSTTSSVTITQPSAVAASISASSNVSCYGGNNGTATAAGSGGTSPYTYSWSNSQSTQTATGLTSGTYTVTVRDANNCSSTTSVTINQPTQIAVSMSQNNVACNGGNTGTATATPSGGTPGYTYSWSNTQTTQTATGLTSGTYTVTVRDANNCSITSSVTITQPTAVSASISSSTNVSCNGGSNGSATVSASGGTPSYTYTWSNSQTTATATNLAAGTYTVTVKDNNNCSTTTSITITQPTALNASFSATNTSCNGGTNGTATATPSGGTSPYTYYWFPSAQTSQTATNLAAGTYNVTITDNKGCTKTGTATVSQPAALSLTMSKTDATCGNSNGSASVSVSGGTSPYTYLWSNTSTSNSITNVTAGTYSVTVTDNHGCTNVNNVAVNNTGAPTVSVNSVTNVTCNGGTNGAASISASGGTPGYTYLWSNGATTTSISNVAAGVYTVTVTDQLTCKGTASVTVTQPTAVVASISGNVSPLCYGASNGSATVSASGGTPGYTYSWSNGNTTVTATNLSAGTYSVTVKDVNNCSTTASVTITQPTQVTSSISASTNVSCNGGNNGSATVSASGGTPGYTYSWSSGATSTTSSGLTAGTYTVTVKDQNNCSSTSSVTITQPAALASTFNTTNVVCNGQNNGSLQVLPTGGTSPYTYLWSNTQTSQTISGLTAGTYTVTITDNMGCTLVSSSTVSQPTSLTSSISASTNVSCNGGNNGSATVSASGGSPSYNYLWSNTQTTATATNLIAGTYTVTVTDSHSCTSISNITITQPTAVSATTSGTSVSCNGGNNGTASVNPTGGTPGYTYLWSNTATTSSITGLTAGTYSVTVKDANNCSTVVSYTVSQPTLLTASISSPTQVACFGGNNGAATVTPTGGTPSYTYLWSSGATTATSSGLTAGTYSVTVRDANNCSTTANVTITQPTQLNASISASTNVSCNGGTNGSATVSASGGTPSYSYSWSNLQTTATASNLAAGTYSVTITDNHSCTTTSSVTITQPTLLTSAISSSTQVSCFGTSTGSATVAAFGGTSPYSYLWSNTQTTATVSNLAAGTYNVTVTDNKGCTSTSSVTITQPTALAASISSPTHVLCYGGNNGNASVSVTGGTPSYVYLWNNGQSTSSISNLYAGTYTVTVTDNNSCTSTASVTITQPTIISITPSSTNVSCNGGSNGTASVTVSGGTPGYTYLWLPGGATTSSINSLTAGTYTVTVTDNNNCTKSNVITISEPPLMTVTPSVVDATCGNSNGQASVSVSGGTTPYTYHWSNNATTPSISSIPAGNYNVTITDANNCSQIETVSVNNTGAPTISIDNFTNVNCFGGNNGTIDISVSGGTPGYSYSWSNGASGTSLSNLVANTYSVTVTDNIGCQATQSIVITQPTAIMASIVSVVPPTCFGYNNGSASVAASGGTPGYFYSWSHGANSQNVNNLSAGNYTVTITDSRGCTTTTSTSVSQPAGMSAMLTSSTNVSCNGGSDGSATISVSGGTFPYSYSWSNGATADNITNVQAGSYTVTIIDANNCTITSGANIIQPAAINISVPILNNVSCNGGTDGSATVNVTGGTLPYSYSWSNTSTVNSITNVSAGVYTLTVTDGHLCTSTRNVTITEPTAIATIITQSNPISCFGGNNGSAFVSASGGTSPYGYHWSTNQSTTSISNLVSGMYYVTVTDLNSCTKIDSIFINQPTQIQINLVADSALCYGSLDGNIDITVSGGTPTYSYTWSNNQSTEDISGLAAGVYSVTVRDANNCLMVASDTIYQPTPIQNTFTETQSHCNQADGSLQALASGGVGPYSYQWDASAANQTTALATSLSAGSYSVIVTDNHACTAMFTGSVSDINAPTILFNVLQLPACNGDSLGKAIATVQGGTLPVSLIWSSGSTTDSIENVPSGTYYLTVTDGAGCISIDSVEITQPDPLVFIVDNLTQPTCFGLTNGAINLHAEGGTTAYNYTWQDSQGNNMGTNADLTNVGAGNYFVTVVDAHNCFATLNLTLSEPTALDLNIGEPLSPKCSNSSDGMAFVIVSGGTSPYNYVWSDALSTHNDTLNNITGNQTYYVTVQDANGCSSIDSVYVNAPTPVIATAYSFSANCNAQNGWAYIEAAGGTQPYSFLWSNAQTNDTIQGLSSGSYSVTVYDSHACTDVQSVQITNLPAGTITVNSITNVHCYGESNGAINISIIGGTAPYVYNWSNADTSANLTNIPAGQYSVTITDANGCTADTILSISQPAILLASASVQNVTCNGLQNGSISLNVNGGLAPYSYLWNNGFQTASITNLTGGTYTVTVTDANNCSIIYQQNIIEPSALQVITTTTNPSCYNSNNGSISVNPLGGTEPYTYAWSTGANTQQINGLNAGSYQVTVTDANLCVSSGVAVLANPIAMQTTGLIGQDPLTNLGYIQTTTIGGTLPYTYLWSNGSTSANISNLVADTYIITVTDANNCLSVDTFTIDIQLVIPSVITPNGDGKNETFEILGIGGYEDISIEIYNRWGDQLFVYQGSGFDYTDPSKQWNGKYNGKDLPMGPYLYIIKISKDKDPITGTITVKY